MTVVTVATAAQAPVPALSDPQPFEGGLGVKTRVLVVDDDPACRLVYAEILRSVGHEVATAADAWEAMEQVRTLGCHAVVSDLLMPGMDGLDLLDGVRRTDPDLPVILATACSDDRRAEHALGLGVVRYLVKPVRSAELVRVVDAAVRLYRIALVKREVLAHLGAQDRLMGDRAGLEAAFSAAMGSLKIAYQPIVRANDGSAAGYEALARTHSLALPDPEALFGAAKRLGRLRGLGRALRSRVAATLPTLSPARVFVNVHPAELCDEELFSSSAPLSLHASSIVLEISERERIEERGDLRSRIQALRGLGYQVALDDLGAAYSGLARLLAFEPDMVKLDLALVRGVDADPVKRKLVASLCRLFKDMGIFVVGEGVETPAERDTLVALGCDLLQGALFGMAGDASR